MNEERYTDETPMPFGMYKDTPLGKLGMPYLRYVWQKYVHKQETTPLYTYLLEKLSINDSTKDNEPTDDTRMPFGKYKGTRLEEVPADYFHYLWTHGMEGKPDDLIHKYIKMNLNGLKDEYPDGIWDT